jgi:hypothetical protein
MLGANAPLRVRKVEPDQHLAEKINHYLPSTNNYLVGHQ